MSRTPRSAPLWPVHYPIFGVDPLISVVGIQSWFVTYFLFFFLSLLVVLLYKVRSYYLIPSIGPNLLELTVVFIHNVLCLSSVTRILLL